jgi:hypothetical protein
VKLLLRVLVFSSPASIVFVLALSYDTGRKNDSTERHLLKVGASLALGSYDRSMRQCEDICGHKIDSGIEFRFESCKLGLVLILHYLRRFTCKSS